MSPQYHISIPYKSSTVHFMAVLILVYSLPPLLLWLGIIPATFRFHVLVIVAFTMILYSISNGYSLRELGIRKDNLGGSLIWNAVLCVLLTAVMLVCYKAGLIRTPTKPTWTLFYYFYVLVSSPAQEFLFRSSLFAQMNHARIKSAHCQVLLSASAYCFMHVVYNDITTLAVTFLMGVAWGLIYHKYPNLLGVTISHALLGIVSIEVGLI